MATKKKSNGRGMLAAEIGAGALAAAAAAGAGYYFYASSDAKKHRKIAAKWADKLQKEVVREAKSLKTLDARTVAGIVDEAVSAYATAKSIDRAELKRAAQELKSNWQRIAVAKAPRAAEALRTLASKGKAKAKKTVKKSATKAAKRRK
jgi:hypothetical protein